jgi:hypothetical protein|tara:strand:+ start:1226 stop:1507 length:282 start_codon:yes stop_codon:yes gene_type:complete
MADEGRLREEMNRGTEAAAILRNPIFIESFESLRTRYATLWADTPPNAPDERERLYVAINVLEDIFDHISSVMQTGEMAGHEIGEAARGQPVH